MEEYALRMEEADERNKRRVAEFIEERQRILNGDGELPSGWNPDWRRSAQDRADKLDRMLHRSNDLYNH
jgi:hypothetical protein